MLIVMHHDATAAQIDHVCRVIKELGFTPHAMPGAQTTAICVTNNSGTVPMAKVANLSGIAEIIKVSKPYKLASIETKKEKTVIDVKGCKIGEGLTMMAGPCSVEEESTTLRIAEQVAKMGIPFFRAGAYKPRTGPYNFQGLADKGLEILQKVKDKLGLRIVTEVMDVEALPAMLDVADVLQIGTRNMSNFSLLKALGKIRTPILLKRGMAATLDEFLLAAEYILAGGNYQVILCERGIRTFGHHARSTLDIAAVPALQKLTHLPIIIDPSHAAGLTYLVAPLARAGVAVGADGLIVEVHDDAENAYSDGQQALHPDQMAKLLRDVEGIFKIIND